MQITIHAGIHKSGTTSIQQAWLAGFAAVPGVLYPEPRVLGPGHAETAYAARHDERSRVQTARLAELTRDAADPRATIEEHLQRAVDLGVDHLVLSSEEFCRLESDDWERVAAIVGVQRTVALFTVSAPSHRWYSIWQELVKSGLAARPADAAAAVSRHALLEPGALERVLTGPRAARTIVRLVRTSPPEPRLPLDLAEAAGLPAPRAADEGCGIANTSLGALAELLRHLNEQGRTLGLLTVESIGRFEAAREAMAASSDFAAPATDFAWPAAAEVAARSERETLERLSQQGIELLDPHALLPSWAEPSSPGWLDEVTRRAWAPYPERFGEHGWTNALDYAVRAAAADERSLLAEQRLEARARELDEALDALAAARRATAEADGRAASANAEREALAERNLELEQEAASIRASRSWRAMAPLRSAAAALRTVIRRG